MPNIKIVQWFDNRFYRLTMENGEVKYLPAFHTVMNVLPKTFLARWRGDIGNREADMRIVESQDRGSRIHHGVYTLLNNGVVIFNDLKHPTITDAHIAELKSQNPDNVIVLHSQREHYQVYKFKKWVDVVAPEVLQKEMIVYSLKDNCAGTLDYVFDIQAGKYEIAGRKPLELEAGNYVVDLKPMQLKQPLSETAMFCLHLKQ